MDIDDMTLQELIKLRTSVNCRIKQLETDAREKDLAHAWNWVKDRKHGEPLWVHSDGSWWGSRLRQGDKVLVHVVQPRKKLLWVTHKGNLYWFNRVGVARLQFRPDPPEKRKVI